MKRGVPGAKSDVVTTPLAPQGASSTTRRLSCTYPPWSLIQRNRASHVSPVEAESDGGGGGAAFSPDLGRSTNLSRRGNRRNGSNLKLAGRMMDCRENKENPGLV
mmetsp:Transcript_14746/g.17695  ORF Transcript_14746/g.17695 Transcript_14746/m.17695 type:complete len:105 (+) Transcript_14746:1152-1466(+)